MREKWLQSLCN